MKNSSRTMLCATPYDTSAPFWYFSSYEEYENKYKEYDPIEEYEIQFIDGSRFAGKLCKKMGDESLYEVKKYFDLLEKYEEEVESDEHKMVSFIHLCDTTNDDVGDILDSLDEVTVYAGKPKDVAYDLVKDSYDHIFEDNPILLSYFDYEAYARDMGYNGELSEYKIGCNDYCVVN